MTELSVCFYVPTRFLDPPPQRVIFCLILPLIISNTFLKSINQSIRLLPYCNVGSLEPLSVFGWAEEVVVGGSLLAAAVLQVEGEQAGEAGAGATSCQQGGDRHFENGHGAASGYQKQLWLQRAHRIQIAPRVKRNLIGETQHIICWCIRTILIFFFIYMLPNHIKSHLRTLFT